METTIELYRHCKTNQLYPVNSTSAGEIKIIGCCKLDTAPDTDLEALPFTTDDLEYISENDELFILE